MLEIGATGYTGAGNDRPRQSGCRRRDNHDAFDYDKRSVCLGPKCRSPPNLRSPGFDPKTFSRTSSAVKPVSTRPSIAR